MKNILYLRGFLAGSILFYGALGIVRLAEKMTPFQLIPPSFSISFLYVFIGLVLYAIVHKVTTDMPDNILSVIEKEKLEKSLVMDKIRLALDEGKDRLYITISRMNLVNGSIFYNVDMQNENING